jgi:hypothetical protein
MEGIHSVDSGILALPIIMEMMLLSVDAAGIEYNSGMSEENEERVINSDLLLSKMEDTNLDNMEREEEPELEESPTINVEVDNGGGLMSRRQ